MFSPLSVQQATPFSNDEIANMFRTPPFFTPSTDSAMYPCQSVYQSIKNKQHKKYKSQVQITLAQPKPDRSK